MSMDTAAYPIKLQCFTLHTMNDISFGFPRPFNVAVNQRIGPRHETTKSRNIKEITSREKVWAGPHRLPEASSLLQSRTGCLDL